MPLGSALKAVATRFTFDFDGAKLAAINRTTGKAVSNLSVAARNAQALKNQVGGFMGNMKGFIALAAGAAIVRGVTTGFSQAADQVAKFAKATGIATDTYQGLIHAAGLSGVTQEEVNKSLLQLSKRAHDAQNGMKETKEAFEEAGVAYKGTNGELLNGDQILLNLANRWKEMPDGTKKTALAMDLMGRTGARLNVLLNEGGEGIKRYIADAKKLGIVLGEDALADAEKFNDEMLRAKSVFIGLRNQISIRLIPALASGAKAFVDWTREGNNAKSMLSALAVVAGIAAVLIGKIVATFVIAQWKVFVGILASAVKWFKALNAQMILAKLKILAMVGAFILLAAVIEDLVFFAQGERSLTGRLFGRDEDLLAGLELIKNEYKAVIGTLSESFGALWESIVQLGGVFGIKLTTVTALLKTIAKWLFKGVLFVVIGIAFAFARVVNWVSILVGWVAHLAAFIVDVLGGAVSGVVALFDDFWGSLQSAFDAIELAGARVSVALQTFFTAAAENVKKAWRGVKTTISDVWEKTKEVFGDIFSRSRGITAGLPTATAPGAVPPAGRAGGTSTTNVTLNTTVNTDPSQDPVAVGKAVVNENQKMLSGAMRSLTGIPVTVPGGIL